MVPPTTPPPSDAASAQPSPVAAVNGLPEHALWDVFCRVIDNHGDLGVLWRLSCELVRRGQRVRLWVDHPDALRWMAPEGLAGVSVRPWQALSHGQPDPWGPRADVWVEGFGCEIDPHFIATTSINTCANGHFSSKFPVWINLEYLTAERYAERSHGLPSPVLSGPAAGHTKWFYFPGFTPATGGLLREADLAQRQRDFDRQRWLADRGIPWAGERLVSLFCYEPLALDACLADWADGPEPTRLLVTAGRAQAAVQAATQRLHRPETGWGRLMLTPLPHLSQTDYDHLLWACDLNAVRGEDSWVRALWAGRPFIWQAYPQDDGAHHAKWQAFLQATDAPPQAWRLHQAWNATADHPAPWPAGGLQPTTELQDWALALRRRLMASDDLAQQLLVFARQRVRTDGMAVANWMTTDGEGAGFQGPGSRPGGAR